MDNELLRPPGGERWDNPQYEKFGLTADHVCRMWARYVDQTNPPPPHLARLIIGISGDVATALIEQLEQSKKDQTVSYNYETEKANLFTEDGMQILLAVRDETRRLLALAGACTAEKAIYKASGSSWTMLAALDYLVERGELRRVTGSDATWGQNQVFFLGIDHS